MSRTRRALSGVVSSYFLLVVTAVYSLASVPVAFHYLDKERFGLWAVMGTLANYLNLIDAGMTTAVARLLIDHKDDRQGGGYGSLIKTGWLVSISQAAILWPLGCWLAPTFAHLERIGLALQPEFVNLVYCQCGVLAFNFASRMFGLILCANQRMDYYNYAGVVSLIANFAVQWLLFRENEGILSLAGGSLGGSLISVLLMALACFRLNLFPTSGGWGRLSKSSFLEMFSYGKDVFLVAVGNQLFQASPVLLITPLLGLEEAAIWSVGIRVFNLLTQVVWKIFDMSNSALGEMMARGEVSRLRERYRSLVILTLSFAGWVAVTMAMCNSRFITLWTHGKIAWPMLNDWLLALWMVILAMVRCHNVFVLLTKQVGYMRYVSFGEGFVLIGLSLLLAKVGGLAAIIGSSILCNLMFSCSYGVWRVHRYFGFSVGEIALGWFRPMSRLVAAYLPIALIGWWLPMGSSPLVHLTISVFVALTFGLFLFMRCGLTGDIRAELWHRCPPRFRTLFKYALAPG